jgi:hypothetical protein
LVDVRIIRPLGLLLVLAALAGGAAGCGGSGSSATPEEQLCSALDEFSTAMDGLESLDLATSSVDDAKQAVSNVADAAKNVVSEAKDVSKADVNELQGAAAALEEALKDFPSAGSIQQIRTALATIGDTGETAIKNLDCNESS